MPDPSRVPVVRLSGIGKRFPGVVANRDVELEVRAGEVHAVVGENGAGKSTLMKILYGMQKPDDGTIVVDGEPVRFSSPADAIAAGIGMVHQHFMLADNLTVLENVALGAEPTRGGRLDVRAGRARIAELSERYGLGVDADALVEDLGVGDRQRVEILKVLYRGARVLILDEPTAVLVPQEVDDLFASLAELRAEGLAVLFISHKLDEVLRVADTVTVLRQGTTVTTVDPASVTPRQLAELMVGSALPSPETRESTVTDVVQLDVRGLTVSSPEGRAVVDDVSLQVHRGEVLGIAGVEGNGQVELVEALLGLRAATGAVRLGEQDISTWTTRARREGGIGYVPEDRHRQGLLLAAPLWENRVLGHQGRAPSRRGLWIDRRAARADTRRIVEEYSVRTPGVGVPAFALSGGNQQKLVVGREMSGSPSLLVASHPTRGVDVGAQAAVWDQLRAARRDGLAVLLVSADLEELIGLSDTLVVMLRGRLVATLDPARTTPETLGAAMTARLRERTPARRSLSLAVPGCRSLSLARRRGPRMSLLEQERAEAVPARVPAFDWRRLGFAVAAPLLATVVALLISSIALLANGSAPLEVYDRMLTEGTTLRSILIIINNAVPLYLSGLAVALGFRMGLFNIGVEGQYQLAALLAASAGAAVSLPRPLHLLLIIVVAMVVGAGWAGIAGVLKTTRGVSEVISTIMLNVIAAGLAAYLLSTHLQERVAGSNNSRTPPLPESARFPTLDPLLRAVGVEPPQGTRLGGFVLVAVVVGLVYWLVVSRSRFGFDLRATGLSPSAAVASGIDAKRMTLVTMLLSGALAGLVGLSQLLGSSFAYGLDFTAGLGFTGIGVALLGRGSPGGIAFAALLFSFLERSSATLQRIDVPTEIYVIMQGTIVLSVVVAYEAVRRAGVAQAERAVRRATGA